MDILNELDLTWHTETVEGMPVRKAVAFSNRNGVYKKGIEKRQRKLLAKIKQIQNFLRDGEEILMVTTGSSPTTMWEQFFKGWWVFFHRTAVLVFTNQRILHLPTKRNHSFRDSIAQIGYGQNIKIKSSTMTVQYANNKKEKFHNLDWRERVRLRKILPGLVVNLPVNTPAERTHLCPQCAAALIHDIFKCQYCGLEFKELSISKKRSILIPGGGYFYTGHPFIGLLDATAETFLLYLLIIACVNAVRGGSEDASFVNVIFLAVVLFIEKLHTIHDCNYFVREFIPKKTLERK